MLRMCLERGDGCAVRVEIQVMCNGIAMGKGIVKFIL